MDNHLIISDTTTATPEAWVRPTGWLRIGDTVGTPRGRRRIVGLSLTDEGGITDVPVRRVPWALVGGNVLVDLADGHWEWGECVKPVAEAGVAANDMRGTSEL